MTGRIIGQENRYDHRRDHYHGNGVSEPRWAFEINIVWNVLHAHTLFNRYYARTKSETIFKIRVDKTTDIDSYYKEGLEIGYLLRQMFCELLFYAS